MTDEWVLDSELGEALHENEIEMAQAIAESIATTVREEYAKEGPPARRDAHPKAHGCVSAEFRVEDILPPNLAQGFFVPGKRYPAWIRFSNGDANPHRSDGNTTGSLKGMECAFLTLLRSGRIFATMTRR